MSQKYCVYNPAHDTFLAFIRSTTIHNWLTSFDEERIIDGVSLVVTCFDKSDLDNLTKALTIYSLNYIRTLAVIPIHEPRFEYLDKYPKFTWGIHLVELLEEWNTLSTV